MTKKATYLVLGVAIAYGAIFFFQRYKRRKSNETVVPYDEAIQKLDELDNL
jgi:predicted negative regulator of RcsB-dependent stress response